MSEGPILSVKPLGFPWETSDPFLFCVHHVDAYPKGDERLGPAASLAGRDLGQDFAGKDGWRMYHGREVPGFPQHPHRGFETVTIVRRGHVDHSDSLGATARFGRGDTQWLTAGRGIVHAEMFPLLDREAANPVELFQIWLNLPAVDKMVEPHFAMLWGDRVPRHTLRDAEGREVEVTTIAGSFLGVTPPAPPPKSWAARPDGDVAIWTFALSPHARLTIPAARAGSRRTLYFHAGSSIVVAGREQREHAAIEVRADEELTLANGPDASELLMLQGRPIGEPVVQYGPFVMSSPQQIRQAIDDYRTTRFGGRPFSDDAPTHPRDAGRFARHADGDVEKK